jgi:hypothetical protein
MSAIKPIPTAPKTNPKSLQNLYTPKEVALQRRFVISLTEIVIIFGGQWFVNQI